MCCYSFFHLYQNGIFSFRVVQKHMPRNALHLNLWHLISNNNPYFMKESDITMVSKWQAERKFRISTILKINLTLNHKCLTILCIDIAISKITIIVRNILKCIGQHSFSYKCKRMHMLSKHSHVFYYTFYLNFLTLKNCLPYNK